MSLTTRKAKVFANVWFCLATLVFFDTSNAYSDSPSNRLDGLVIFFKQAISAPPDVEKYTVSQYSFGPNSFFYYSGARAGSNYFLQQLYASNGPIVVRTNLVTGRSGTTEYERGRNGISYGIGSNGFTGNVGVLYTLTRQFLDMGISEIVPESVKWDGDTFTATNSLGVRLYGELSISNGLPSSLEISLAKGSPPYKVLGYTYPDPPSTLDGFPSKIAVFGRSKGALTPRLELQFYSVQLAAKPLSDNYFAAAQFITPNIIHTNVYSNSDLYLENNLGKMVKAPDSFLKSGGYTNSRPRIVIFICFALITVLPIAYFIFIRKKQK